MSTYVEYSLSDGSIVWIEADTSNSDGMTLASRDESGNAIIQSSRKFAEAFQGVKATTTVLLEELESLPVEEMEIAFGLKTTGEAGIFAVGKVGMEANYEVKVKWKRPEEKRSS